MRGADAAVYNRSNGIVLIGFIQYFIHRYVNPPSATPHPTAGILGNLVRPWRVPATAAPIASFFGSSTGVLRSWNFTMSRVREYVRAEREKRNGKASQRSGSIDTAIRFRTRNMPRRD
jgi:hypothetical protein